MLDDSKTGWLASWLTRLEHKVEDLEKEAAEGKIEKLAKDLATCDSYLKKLYTRARDSIFQTADGPGAVRDIARIKVRLERLRKQLPRGKTRPDMNLQNTHLRENLA